MWNTIANFKENLNQIALEVQDAAEELEIYRSGSGEDSSISDRRISHRFAQAKSPLRSPIANGIDSGFKAEIEKYQAEIQRLQASEAEIKALSVNYAAILKEKEEHLSRLHGENSSLRKNLEATNVFRNASRNESLKTSMSNPNVLKGSTDQSPSRQYRLATQVNNRSIGNHTHKGIVSKQDALSNGSSHAIQSDGIQHHMDPKDANFQGNDKVLAGLLEEHNKSLAAMQAKYESEIKQLRMELDKERNNLADVQLKLQEEHELNESFQKELHSLKMDKDEWQNPREMKAIQNELNDKISEIRRLQLELTRRDSEEEQNETSQSLRRVIATLKQENANLEMEKTELKTALKFSANSSPGKSCAADSNPSNNHSSYLNEVESSKSFPEKEEMELSIQKLEKDLKGTRRERDKALQELTRLKQHLLDKELEESDKMDEDNKIIEELRANCDYQRAQILHLEKALKQAIAGQEEVKKINNNELQKSKEMINDLKLKLVSCISTIDAKNVELLNLQTALGQYYAENEAKERLERDLTLAREESARLSKLLKDANHGVEMSEQEKKDMLAKLSHMERMLSDGKSTIQKLEGDNIKLRHALEQIMTRLNRMSMDSDYFVDRRIVIKLLVTYFQRNHSTEVLDLMVRMLGFSEEDKQRIGVAQKGSGKGVVRGVLGLPGRLVGGILSGSSTTAHVPSDNQSFSDLWVDFLLKETEEREKRVSAEANASSGTPTTTGIAPLLPNDYGRTSATPSFHRTNPSVNMSPLSSMPPEHSDMEFSTVPLTSSVSPSSENNSRISRLLPRY